MHRYSGYEEKGGAMCAFDVGHLYDVVCMDISRQIVCSIMLTEVLMLYLHA
jgi:hypothetical protein